MDKYINQIINADCLDVLKELPDKCIDLVCTDPPYLLDNRGGRARTGDFVERKLIKLKHINWTSQDFDYISVFNEFIRVCKKANIFIFCSNAQISRTMSFFEKKVILLLVWFGINQILYLYAIINMFQIWNLLYT